MNKLICLLFILACAPLAHGQTMAHKSTGQTEAEQELTQLVRDECEAVLENHAAVLDRILAAEFQMHTVDGHIVAKPQMGPYLRAALPPSIAGLCEVRALVIKVEGRKATTGGQMWLRASLADGTEQPLQFQFEQRLVRRAHRWQATRIEFRLPDQP